MKDMCAYPVFDQHFAWLSCNPCRLPFQLGGATQNGRLGGHTVNQDALALLSRDAVMVGVVCDGCGNSVTGQSNNEVGARAIAGSSVVLLEEMLKNATVDGIASRITEFERTLCERILGGARSLFPEPALDYALHSFFMTTMLAFVVDETNYLVFGCGDGFYALNSEFHSLDKNAGAYLTGRLLDCPKDWRERVDKGEGALHVLAQGPSEFLSSLLLASDGFENLIAEFPEQLRKILEAPPGARRGFDQQLVIDFRARFWHLPELQQWAESRDAYDDSSFLLLRRVPPPIPASHGSLKEEATNLCSKSPAPISEVVADCSPHFRRSRRRSSRVSSQKTQTGDPKTRPKD